MQAIRQIVGGLGLRAPRVLDVGAGDGYLIHALHAALGFQQSVAQDIHLTESLARELSKPGVEFVRELDDPSYRAELILLLDVIEHVEDPVALLAQLRRDRLAPGGRVLITVPAFQRLYTAHDRALKHFRRYSRAQLLAEARSAGFDVIDSGYLFASLLLPRAAQALRERLLPKPRETSVEGVGSWQQGALLTQLIHSGLVLDNRLCLAASERGLRVPGLTVWLTCKTSS